MNDRWTGLVVLRFVYPHGLERRQRGEDGTTEPNGEFSLWRRQNFNLIGRWRKLVNFLPHALTHAVE